MPEFSMVAGAFRTVRSAWRSCATRHLRRGRHHRWRDLAWFANKAIAEEASAGACRRRSGEMSSKAGKTTSSTAVWCPARAERKQHAARKSRLGRLRLRLARIEQGILDSKLSRRGARRPRRGATASCSPGDGSPMRAVRVLQDDDTTPRKSSRHGGKARARSGRHLAHEDAKWDRARRAAAGSARRATDRRGGGRERQGKPGGGARRAHTHTHTRASHTHSCTRGPSFVFAKLISRVMRRWSPARVDRQLLTPDVSSACSAPFGEARRSPAERARAPPPLLH